MRATFISTSTLLDTPRTGVLRKQVEMARLSKEISTGRMADVGLNLGAATGRAASLHIDTAAIDGLIDANGATVERMKQSQAALSKMTSDANTFLQQLIVSRNAGTPLGQLGGTNLAGFVSDANTGTTGGGYLFGGINSAIKPVADYSAGPKAEVDAAFLAAFGIVPGDAGAENITAAGMSTFLDTQFAALFGDPDWGTTWSSASDTPVKNRISTTETVETSVGANEQAMRRLAMAYTMVAGLGIDKLGEGARQAVVDKAIAVLGEAIGGVTALGQRLGAAENRVTAATTRLTLQKDILERRISIVEGVDPAEAKVRLDTLATQVEMSYSLTVKLLQMSILNYA